MVCPVIPHEDFFTTYCSAFRHVSQGITISYFQTIFINVIKSDPAKLKPDAAIQKNNIFIFLFFDK